MGCPYYIDFTRDCIRTYPAIIENRDFTPCETDGYRRCIVYNILQSPFRCQHLDTCLNMFPKDIPDFYTLLNQDPAIYDFVTTPVYPVPPLQRQPPPLRPLQTQAGRPRTTTRPKPRRTDHRHHRLHQPTENHFRTHGTTLASTQALKNASPITHTTCKTPRQNPMNSCPSPSWPASSSSSPASPCSSPASSPPRDSKHSATPQTPSTSSSSSPSSWA